MMMEATIKFDAANNKQANGGRRGGGGKKGWLSPSPPPSSSLLSHICRRNLKLNCLPLPRVSHDEWQQREEIIFFLGRGEEVVGRRERRMTLKLNLLPARRLIFFKTGGKKVNFFFLGVCVCVEKKMRNLQRVNS